jgi:alkylhydroperoxidase family enzyme
MSTPRIEPGTRRDVGLLVAGFARLAGRVTGTEPPAVFLTLGRQRRLFWGWLHFAGTLMPGGRLPRREAELVILRVATRCGSEYELTQHRRLGRRAGLSAEEVERVQQPELSGWSGPDDLLLRAVDELHETRDLGDEVWADLRASYDEATLVELVMLVGHYEMLATTLGTLRVQPDRPRSRARSRVGS